MPLLSVSDLIAGYRSGAFTPEQICDQALARARSQEPRLNAFISLDEQAIRRDAQRASQDITQGRFRGPLHGIPVAIKDIIDVAHQPTSHATRAVPAEIAAKDATCVARLRQAGAIPFGKTNLLEFAYGVAHPAFGQTMNPHDACRSAGGSSGGSAAAVAAGIVPIALGTDTGGSVRAPAAYCGCVGFKPSYGALPMEGVFALAPSLDHLGILASSCSDARQAFAAMGGNVTSVRPATRAGLVTSHWFNKAVTKDVRIALERALSRLEAAGIEIIEVDLPPSAFLDKTLMDILLPEAASVHAKIWAQNPAGYAPQTAAQIEAGLSVSAVTYIQARNAQRHLRQQMDAILEQADILLSPTVPFVAPATNPALSDSGDDEILSLSYANLTGCPALSLPVMTEGALPVGLQLSAGIGQDALLLATAESYESILAAERRDPV